MAKKITPAKSTGPAKASAPARAVTAAPAATVGTSAVRNSPIPRVAAAAARKEVTREQIAFRAYEIWQSAGGSPDENWTRAERELRGL